MKNQLLDKLKNSLLTNEQKAVVFGGARPCINASVATNCSCSRTNNCETVSCNANAAGGAGTYYVGACGITSGGGGTSQG